MIERADRGDLPAILDLQYLAYQSEADLLGDRDIPPLKQKLEDVAREFENGIILKALDAQGTIIGSVRGHSENETLHIGKLIVHPAYQGQGIGTKLLLEMETICPKHRYALFTSSRSLRNLTLYKRLGYVPYKEESITSRLTFIHLEKNIHESTVDIND
ncbi:MAG: GNAT family N-acetyltransferase [Oscillospiraceae bacterium]|jgi:GNAT superfamily N-acetyltransferase|nr:GNAT family N-acetyltransferase [Oscillospiraceae bacterium]